MLWMNEILRDLRLRRVSKRYPILHKAPELYHNTNYLRLNKIRKFCFADYITKNFYFVLIQMSINHAPKDTEDIISWTADDPIHWHL